MWLHELAVSDSLCRPCAGNCSPDVEVLVRALRSRLGRLNLVYVYISGQTNCSGFARRKKKPSLRPVSAGDHVRKDWRDEARQRRLVELCVDNCKLSGWRETHASCVIIFFFIWLSLSPFLSMVTLSLFLRFSLSTFLFDFYLSSFLSLVLPYLSVLFLSSFFAVPYVCLNRLASPFLSLVWDQWHLMLSTLPD